MLLLYFIVRHRKKKTFANRQSHKYVIQFSLHSAFALLRWIALIEAAIAFVFYRN